MNVVALRGTTERDGPQVLAAMRTAEPTTAGLEMRDSGAVAPPGFGSAHHALVIGHGEDDFAFARGVLAAWKVHQRAGVRVWHGPPLLTGETVLLVLPILAFEVRIACRIVNIEASRSTFGFTYATLPCHPEIGQERFLITLAPDGTVTFSIDVFWKPNQVLARIGGPLTKAMQRAFTHRYLKSMRDSVCASESG